MKQFASDNAAYSLATLVKLHDPNTDLVDGSRNKNVSQRFLSGHALARTTYMHNQLQEY